MVDISRGTYEKKYVETHEKRKHDNETRNEKHKEKGLVHKNLQVTIVKYPSSQRKHISELVDEPKNNPTEFLCAKD